MESEDTLVNEGWEVRHVGVVHNPGTWTATTQQGYPPRFWAVYTKLMIFNLTEYSTGAVPVSFTFIICICCRWHLRNDALYVLLWSQYRYHLLCDWH